MKSLVSFSLVVLVCLGTLFFPNATATHDPNDFWVRDYGPNTIRDIHGSSSTNVWAAQHINLVTTQFTFALKRNGPDDWTPIEVPLSRPDEMFVLSPTLNWVVGVDDAARYDGTSYTAFDTPCQDFTSSVWASASNDVWFGCSTSGAGATFSIARYDGSSLTGNFDFTDPVTTQETVDLYGFASNNVWALRRYSAAGVFTWQIWHYTGTWAKTFDSTFGGEDAFSIWGTSSTNLFVSANTRPDGTHRIYRSTDSGVSWTNVLDQSKPMQNDEGYFGGQLGNIWYAHGIELFHSADGITFTTEPSPFTSNPSGLQESISGIWFSSGSEGFISNEVNAGFGIFRNQVNPNVAIPSLAAFDYDPDNLHVSASQAQCNGDRVSFTVNTEPPLAALLGSTLTGYVIDTQTNVVMQEISEATWTNNADKEFSYGAVYPSGDYKLLVTILNTIGIDPFASVAFNVPVGTCVDTPFDDSELRAFIIERTNQTNGYVNTTSSSTQFLVTVAQNSIQSQLTSVHSHIDGHFNTTNALIVNQFLQTNGYINTSRIQILDAIGDISVDVNCGANQTDNCTFEAQSIVDFPGLTDEQVGAFLLFFVVLILSFFQRWLFVAIACVIGILDVFVLGGIFGFEFTALLLVIAVMLQIYVDHRDAHREEQAQREAKGDGLSDGN